MNQDAFACLQLGQFDQPIPGGEEGQRDRCGFGITELIRDRDQLVSRHGDIAGKGPFGTGQPHHSVAHGERGHSITNRSDLSGTLKTQTDCFGIGNAEGGSVIFFHHAQRVEHIAEVQAHGLDRHFDFTRCRLAAGHGHEGEVFK